VPDALFDWLVRGLVLTTVAALVGALSAVVIGELAVSLLLTAFALISGLPAAIGALMERL
jgi:hypothetical protein